MKYTVLVGDRSYEIDIGSDNTVTIDGEPHAIDFRAIDGQALYSLLLDNKSWEVAVDRREDEYRVAIGDAQLVLQVEDERTHKIGKGLSQVMVPGGEITIKAPMPGLVRAVPVQQGQEVKAGQGVIILEAMKMENELRSPRAGHIGDVRVKSGDKVEQGQVLVVIK